MDTYYLPWLQFDSNNNRVFIDEGAVKGNETLGDYTFGVELEYKNEYEASYKYY